MSETAASPEIDYFVSYPCAGCGATLSVRVSRVDTWHRCPSCGRSGLPPDGDWQPDRSVVTAGNLPGDETLVIGPLFDPPGVPAPPAGPPARRRPLSVRRVVTLLLLAMSVSLMIDALASRNMVNAVLGAILGAIGLFLMMRPAR